LVVLRPEVGPREVKKIEEFASTECPGLVLVGGIGTLSISVDLVRHRGDFRVGTVAEKAGNGKGEVSNCGCPAF